MCAGGNVAGSQREQHDRRIGRIDLAIGGLPGKIGGKLAASGVDGGLNVARGGVDVAIEIKLKNDAGGTEAARGGHLRDAGDASELALERRSDGRGHGFRARAGETSANRDGWKIDLRQRRDGKKRNATTRERKMAMVISDVATGRRMKGAEKLKRNSRLVPVRGFLNRIADVELEAPPSQSNAR